MFCQPDLIVKKKKKKDNNLTKPIILSSYRKVLLFVTIYRKRLDRNLRIHFKYLLF